MYKATANTLSCGRYIPKGHSTSHFAPFDSASHNNFIPKPSRDSALTSFAQLGAIRLGTQRALISLFDRTHQHIIAEATPTLSLLGGTPQGDRDRLRLGSCVLPKNSGFCQYVEHLPLSEFKVNSASGEDSALVISDVTEDERFMHGNLLHALSDVRFYAAVPIVSPRGFIIGAYSIMDSEARPSGLEEHSLLFMKDMAATIMGHLLTASTARKSHLAKMMIVGLGSFAEGKSTLRDSWREAQTQHAASEQSGEPTEGQLDIQQQYIQESARRIDEKTFVLRKSINSDSQTSRLSPDNSNPMTGRSQSQQPRMESTQLEPSVRITNAGDDMEEMALSTNIKTVFSRAANLIRESIEVEGVMFLDADSDHFGSLVDPSPGTKESSSDENTDSKSSSRRNNGEPDSASLCTCLGFSSSRGSSINDDSVVGRETMMQEPLLEALLRRYPRGKIFSYSDGQLLSDYSDGIAESWTNDSDHDSTPEGSHNDQRCLSRKEKRKPTLQRDADHLIKIFPTASNILIMPVWDSDKRRCTAGALVWTNDPRRIFTPENELVYTLAFTNNIMAQIRRLDVEMADKAKTNLFNSITHELRTPLHGILGTADILGDTAMNAMQYGMIHTIESCGRTLLDTINSLLDLNFIDKYQKKASRLSGSREAEQAELPFGLTEGGRAQSKDRGEAASSSHVKLDEVLEEVIESVFAGHCFYAGPNAPPPSLTGSATQSAGSASAFDQLGPNPSSMTIIFDIQPDVKWDFLTHAGAWRRILMNVFGNALKYTHSGYIYIGLHSSQSRAPSSYARSPSAALGEQLDEEDVTLTVKDTGKGIDRKFLHNDLFTPFMQEDPIASGSGLGLSIVHKAVGSLGGSIEIDSTKGVGTEVLVRAPLIRIPGRTDVSSKSMLSTLQIHTKGKTIGILGFGSTIYSQRDRKLYSALERCCEWFGLKVTSVTALDCEPVGFDFYLAVQAELDSEDTEGKNIFASCKKFIDGNNCSSPIVVICQSPGEAHRLSIAAETRAEASNFDFICQPCGPRKLARALDLCLKRRFDRQSGQPSPWEATRWVEMPESSHLPLNIDISDSPEERMKISKRLTTDTTPSSEFRIHPPSSPEPTPILNSRDISKPPSSLNEAQGNIDHPNPSILLVDDNEINLRLLCAYSKKGNFEYTTACNGAEAVAAYEAYPGQIRVIILGMSKRFFRAFVCCVANFCAIRYFYARHGWFRGGPTNTPPRERAPSCIK
jgi:signal transduction histidine kinase